ncbi:hypothetical protein GL218_04212 [Daldinia childiae]|uniref:uncharacterized protein n=1 Tax=Daldinia childiae TaxID=326645 RepID=UPI001447A157|nr:uncharacterized protein GL218_04212 [Daldinia childiae]KAF3061971.1 hypothetical protein GL218_04212 [Daldinia childiae]
MADTNPDSKPWHKKVDLIQRGDRSPTPWGTLTFIGLRLLDLPLQHALLAPAGLGSALLARAGITSAAAASPAVLHTGIPFIDALGRPTSALLFVFACGSAAKQIYWQTVLSYESFPAGAAAAVALYNTVMNSTNGVLSLASSTSSLFSQPQITIALPFLSSSPVDIPLSTLLGLCMYVFGLSLETVSEAQRKAFKDAPENKGKVCKVGVWRWARHVNYLGYSLWRGGYTMVATGWIGGLVMTAWQMWDLSYRAAGVLDDYCTNKYKEQWAQFKREVPYKILPGIY